MTFLIKCATSYGAAKFSGSASSVDHGQDKGDLMAKVMTKSQVIQALADAHKQRLVRKDVAKVLESLATVGHRELKKTGIFVLPGFAKFLVLKKPATKERPGINPFTKEPITIKAKPARKVLKARPVKAAKDAVA
jgi:nucleoid DNA-binding protein